MRDGANAPGAPAQADERPSRAPADRAESDFAAAPGRESAAAVPAVVAAERYMWIVLATAIFTQITYSLPNQGIGAITPFLQADLAMSREQIGLLVSFAQIGMGIAFLPGGWATDRFGCRSVTSAGLALVIVAVLTLAQARDIPWAYVGTFLGGAGVGITSPPVTMMILRWFPTRTRGTAMGLKQAGTPIGGMLAALWLPPASHVIGWRLAVAAVALAIVASVLLVLLLYRDPSGTPRPERRAGGPRLTAAIFSRPVLVMTCYSAVLVTAQFCVIGYTVLFVTEWLGQGAVAGGWALSATLAGGMVGRVVWGIISDRVFHGARKPALTAAGGVAALALGLLALLPRPTPLLVVFALGFVVGFAVLGWQGVGIALTAELAGPSDAGRVVGFSLMALQVGPIVGPPLVGRLLDATGSYPLAWALVAATCAVGTLGFAATMVEPTLRPARSEKREPRSR